MGHKIVEETEIAQHNFLVLNAAKEKMIHMIRSVGANKFCETEIAGVASDFVESYSWKNPDLIVRSDLLTEHALTMLDNIQKDFWIALEQYRREHGVLWNLLMWVQIKYAEWRLRQISIVCRKVRELYRDNQQPS